MLRATKNTDCLHERRYQRGAATYHEAMLSYGYPRVILTVARKVMQNTNLLFGLGTVENGYGQTARIGVCPEMGKIPLTMKNDKEAIEIAIKCAGLIPREKLKIMRIKNTSRLSEVQLSEAYEDELST